MLWMETLEVLWTDGFFMPRMVEIQVAQPQQEDDYQEYPELEILDGLRYEADIIMSKLDIQCHSE